MELTQSNKQKETTSRNALTRFIDRHADVFEALSRTGTPFGGNWLAADRAERRAHRIEISREQLADLQRQLNVLNETIAELSEQVDAQPTPSASRGNSPRIGINRFRELQTRF